MQAKRCHVERHAHGAWPWQCINRTMLTMSGWMSESCGSLVRETSYPSLLLSWLTILRTLKFLLFGVSTLKSLLPLSLILTRSQVSKINMTYDTLYCQDTPSFVLAPRQGVKSKLSYIINERSHVDLLSASHGSLLIIPGNVSLRRPPLTWPCSGMSFVKLSLDVRVCATLRVVVLTHEMYANEKRKRQSGFWLSPSRMVVCACVWVVRHKCSDEMARGHPSCVRWQGNALSLPLGPRPPRWCSPRTRSMMDIPWFPPDPFH